MVRGSYSHYETSKNTTDIEKRINVLFKKAVILKKFRLITNEILSNMCYHEKNMTMQEANFNKLNVPQEEKDIINRAWNIKNKMAKTLASDLEGLLDYAEKYYDKK